jgi:ADP-ribose pyrophosphatase
MIEESGETWEVLGSKVVLRHPFTTVTFQHVRLPDGREIADWPIVHLRDYVNVVPVDAAGRVMLLVGYKHGPGRSSLQVVGGYLEDGEDPLEAARRELLEETGYASREWEGLGSFVVDANRRAGVAHFFLARNVAQVAPPDHDDLEGFTLIWEPLHEVKRALRDGRVAVISYASNLALALLALEEQ